MAESAKPMIEAVIESYVVKGGVPEGVVAEMGARKRRIVEPHVARRCAAEV